MKVSRWFLLFVGLILFCDTTIAAASGHETVGINIDPMVLLNDISKQGSRAVVSKLYSDPNSWNYVLRQVAAGKEAWLKVAVALHPGSDAGSSEMLSLTVGEALETSPENVFRIALREFQLESICSGPDVDDVRYNSYELSMRSIKRRQDRVSAISDPELTTIVKKCAQELEKAKAGIVKFYGITK